MFLNAFESYYQDTQQIFHMQNDHHVQLLRDLHQANVLPLRLHYNFPNHYNYQLL